MLLEAIYHRAGGRWAYPVGRSVLRIVLRAKKGDLLRCTLYYGDRYAGSGAPELETVMEPVAQDQLFDYFAAEIALDSSRVKYMFLLEDGMTECWFTERGFYTGEPPSTGHFQYPYICEADMIELPSWARGTVFYQIFPERFANGDPFNDPPGTRPWGDKPGSDTYFGGDLKGVMDRLSYLSDLGIGCIYLTPIFKSPSTHKYDTTDYFSIDPAFGDTQTLKKLVEKCHNLGIRVILDGVFNHCGEEFPHFQDVLKYGKNSSYADWFNIRGYPLITDTGCNYETFATNVRSMPKLMTRNPEVRKYLVSVGEYWIKTADIDGWRLDVANEVDHSFWREFRDRVKRAKPDAFLVGEIWHQPTDWLGPDQFDSVMNYPFRDAVIEFIARRSTDSAGFDAMLTASRMAYPIQYSETVLNLLGSHDTERFLTLLGGRTEKARLAAVFQMTYPGSPMIYYGDEVGMEGGPDPDCRRCMVWDESRWNAALLDTYRRIIRLRRAYPELREGEFKTIFAGKDSGIYAFERHCKTPPRQDRNLFVLLNNADESAELELRLELRATGRPVVSPVTAGEVAAASRESGYASYTSYTDLLSDKRYTVSEGTIQLKLPPYGAAILIESGRRDRMS